MPGEVANIALIMDRIGPEDASCERPASFMRLVERAKSGDTAAFEQLMILSQRKVVSTAWRLLGSEDDARDAAQEVFLRAFKYLGRFKSERDFYAWLYGITINVCRDMARRRGPSPVSAPLETDKRTGPPDPLASAEDAEARVLLAQRRAMIARALATLPVKERAVIILRDLEGLSTDEVARIMGSRPTTIRSQISTARAKIKQYCDRLMRQERKR
jgi:RNA polymerase sigma-70 factor (ECF subfamily)